MSDTVIKIEGLKKQYRLGTIGGGTLTADLQSWWAKKRGKEDPNSVIGAQSVDTDEYFWALRGIDLEVHQGEAVGIIGHNGAGKSTLLKLLSRVTAPTEGNIKIQGRVTSMLEVGTGFHPEMTGRENIYLNGAILGMSRKEVDAKIDEIIEFSECGQFIDTPVKRYSSGMYVKLAFAVAAHLDSEIIIMDEVLAVGDVKFQKKCLGKMGNAANNDGKTVLYVSHNMSTIRQLCSRCIVLDHGRVIFDGDVEKAISVYADADNAEFVPKYELREAKRPSHDHGRFFRISHLAYKNVKAPIYNQGDKIRFSFEYESSEAYSDVGVYFTVITTDEQIVGTTQSNTYFDVTANNKGTIDVEFDAGNIIPGDYYFYIDVFYKNEFGTFLSIDHPSKKIYFRICQAENNGIIWNRQYFGNVYLNNLSIICNR